MEKMYVCTVYVLYKFTIPPLSPSVDISSKSRGMRSDLRLWLANLAPDSLVNDSRHLKDAMHNQK